MNTSKNVGAVDLMILAVMTLAWATWQVVRLLLVPLLAVLIVLLTPRRRPAPQPAAVAPGAASSEAPAPGTATVEAAEPEAAAAPAERVLAPLTLATIATDLMELPAAELRRLAGTRRRLPKAQLIAVICAMPL